MVENDNKNFEERTAPKKKKISCLVAGLVIIIFCISLCTFASLPIRHETYIAKFPTYRSEWSSPFAYFFHAIRTNDIQLARELVSEDNYPRLDEWAINHQGNCYPPIWVFTNDDPIESIIGGGAGSVNNETNTARDSYGEQYYRFNQLVYSFHISDMETTLINDRWIITDWGKIDEYYLNEKIKKKMRCVDLPNITK